MSCDISGSLWIFFKEFRIKPCTITLKQREELEDFFLSNDFNLTYSKDQWWGVKAERYIIDEEIEKIIEDCYAKKIAVPENIGDIWKLDLQFKGEGESSTEALLGLCIDARELFDESDLYWLRTKVFKASNFEDVIEKR